MPVTRAEMLEAVRVCRKFFDDNGKLKLEYECIRLLIDWTDCESITQMEGD